MKKLLASVLAGALMLLGTNAFAQDITYAAGGGFTQFFFSGSDADDVDYPDLPGFYFGANMTIPFSELEGLAFQPGIYFQHYGKEETVWGTERSFHLNYFDIPILIKYGVETDSGIIFDGFTGPKFNIGLGGNGFDKSRLGVKNFDAQWTFGGSVTFSHAIRLLLSYDLGINKDLKDLSNDLITIDTSDLKVRRNGLNIGIEFLF